MSLLLTLNAGGSSVKIGVFRNGAEPQELASGQVARIGKNARLEIRREGGEKETQDCAATNHREAVEALVEEVREAIGDDPVVGVGHRVVHGGPDFYEPEPITPALLEEVRKLAPLAPLHQPNNIAGIEAAQAMFPNAPQIACFDTAFHRNQPFVHEAYGLPRRYFEAGVLRYGFHGLSYDYIASMLEREYPDLMRGKVIIAHLGDGASMCALDRGRSLATTMGFSPLDGLLMGSRPGHLDPGVLLYMMQAEGMTAEEISRMLYHESGLKGLSGITRDMRALLADGSDAARTTIDYFVSRLHSEIGSLTASLGGLDALVFTGGIGENSAPIRAAAAQGMHWLGLEIDADANESGETEISKGRVKMLAIPTDEEQVIARAVADAL